MKLYDKIDEVCLGKTNRKNADMLSLVGIAKIRTIVEDTDDISVEPLIKALYSFSCSDLTIETKYKEQINRLSKALEYEKGLRCEKVWRDIWYLHKIYKQIKTHMTKEKSFIGKLKNKITSFLIRKKTKILFCSKCHSLTDVNNSSYNKKQIICNKCKNEIFNERDYENTNTSNK